jgi:5-oxoprolinase (ATP-hydrolysing)/N-methylhydantoinase B
MIRRAGSDEWKPVTEDSGAKSPSKFADITVHPGDRVRFSTPGGGGFGDPAERDPEAVRADVVAGYVSVDAASVVYGASLDTGAGEEAAAPPRKPE